MKEGLTLKNIRSRLNRRILGGALISGIVTLVFSLGLPGFQSYLFWAFPVYVTGIFLLARHYWFSKEEIRTHLHLHHEDLEYSLSLLEYPDTELNLLGKLQKKKIMEVMQEIDLKLPSLNILFAFLLIWSMIYFSGLVIFKVNEKMDDPGAAKGREAESISISEPSQNAKAGLENLYAMIYAPAYTGIADFRDEDLQLELAEGSEVEWSYEPQGPVEKVTFVFGDEETLWDGLSAGPVIKFFTSTFYRYIVEDSLKDQKVSDYLPIKIIADEPPQLQITGVPEYQRLPWSRAFEVPFNISVEDDYGLEEVYIVATVATGSGESVKFRERHIPVSMVTPGAHKFDTNFQLRTEEFGMEPGSELYFYLLVKDNCPFRIQATKSKTHFVIFEDTSRIDLVDGGGMQVDLMPEFFRSQRQIIIDTEKLLTEKSTLDLETFRSRSNELGFDQKMLRLKYGQFLGEEAESGIALENSPKEENENQHHDHDHDEEAHSAQKLLEEYGHNHDHEDEEHQLLETRGTEASNPSRPAWMEGLMHQHDDGETNTYFEVSIKTKLKAALSVMWDAELHLRLYDPQASLPYQYEALKLLEDIKNHARVYVHRIGFEPPVIKEREVRLTGKLEEVKSGEITTAVEVEKTFPELKKVIQTYSSLRSGDWVRLSEKEKIDLESAGKELAMAALEDPGLLPLLTEMRRLLDADGALSADRLIALRYAWIEVLPPEQPENRLRPGSTHPLVRKVLRDIKEVN